MSTETKVNDGVFFVEPDHPVCQKCASSLDRDERCWECGGDGFVETAADDWEYETDFKRCPECRGLPAGWFCPTCNRHWEYHEIKLEDES